MPRNPDKYAYVDMYYSKYHRETLFVLAVLGAAEVGKTALIQCFGSMGALMTEMEENCGYIETEEPQNSHHSVDLGVDVDEIILEVWDTPGHKRLESVALEVCYRPEMHGHMIVFDVTNTESFNHATRILANLKKHKAQISSSQQQQHVYLAQRNNYLVLVGNKCDLASSTSSSGSSNRVGEEVVKRGGGDLDDSLREVSFEAASALAAEYNSPYIEVSAATGLHVKEAFERLASDIRCMVHEDEASHYI